MFYNDPMLYGATLPYRDVNFQAPFVPQYHTPWQNLQRFIPQPYAGWMPGYQDHQRVPYSQIQQFPGYQGFPLQIPFQQIPFQQIPFQQIPFQQIPFQQLPQQAWSPFPLTYGMNGPFYGYGVQRPFVG